MVVLEQQDVSILTILSKVGVSLVPISVKVRVVSQYSRRQGSPRALLGHLQELAMPVLACTLVEGLNDEAIVAY